MARRRTLVKERYEAKQFEEYTKAGNCPYCKKRIGRGIYQHARTCKDKAQ